MRDHLLDLVEHTFDLGCIDLVKITGTAKETLIAGLAEDRSVVVEGRFLTPVPEFTTKVCCVFFSSPSTRCAVAPGSSCT